MFNRILSKLFFFLFILTFLFSSESNFWNTFLESPNNEVELDFSPLNFTIINSSNVWGETEPCG